MEIRILGCYGGQLPGKNLTSFLIDDTILVDAGGATSALRLEELQAIRTIIVSHSHLDHVKDIPFIADNVIGRIPAPLEIIAIDPTIDALRDQLMGNVIWPDFTSIPTPQNPVLRYRREKIGKPFKVGSYKVEFIPVNHPVPCVAMLFKWPKGAFVYTGDTGPTEEIWKRVGQEKNLKGLITEVSFPNSMEQLSLISGHLSPCHIDSELAKTGRDDIPVYLYHIKPGVEQAVRDDVRQIKYRNLHVLEQGETLQF